MKIKNYMRGLTIVEVMVTLAIFSLISSVIFKSYTNANLFSERASAKSEALWLSEEGIEGTRAIRDQSFTNLIAGTKGLSRSAGAWQFSGASDTTDGFQRSITLASGGTDIMLATSTVSWSDHGATSTVALATVLTNWKKNVGTTASHFAISTASSCVYTLDSRYMGGITLTYDGSTGTTTIPQMQVAWTPTTTSLNQILTPYPTVGWTGTAASGATTTLTTPITFTTAGSMNVSLRWSASVTGKNFTVTFIFGDGSSQTVTIVSPILSICI